MFKQDLKNTSNQVLKKKYRLLLGISILGILGMIALIVWQVYSDRTTDDNINVIMYVPIIIGPIAIGFALWADTFGKELKKRKKAAKQV